MHIPTLHPLPPHTDSFEPPPHIPGPDHSKLSDACRQFEALLLRQILTAARKSVINSQLNTESTTSAIYNDIVNSQLADSISASGAFGLASTLQLQLAPPTTPNSQLETPSLETRNSKLATP